MNILSVLICTHNPKQEYLTRALLGLKNQTLDYSYWELIIVDNASKNPIRNQFDISWHPKSRFVTENQLGLTNARLKGISEAKGDLLVFFDDDNVPNPDYLEKAKEIALNYSLIGAFGGSTIGEFEAQPPDWMKDKLSRLAVREVKRTIWSNLYKWETTPAGAGMVIRTDIARQFAKNTRSNPLRQILDRKGNNTMSAGDIDLAYTSIDMGYGCGLFTELELIHIIPKERVEKQYLLRLSEGIAISQHILNYLRYPAAIPKNPNPIRKMLIYMYVLLFNQGIEFQLERKYNQARTKARKIIANTNI